jgi:serralysin
VFRTATPTDLHLPMNLIANLALGGWGGEIDAAALPAELRIDYIRAFDLPDASAPAPGPKPPPTPASLFTLSESASPTSTIKGKGKAETLQGTKAADLINGEAGADTMIGGAADDTYMVDTTDLVRELVGEGIDTVISTATRHQLAEHVENLTLQGSGIKTGIGNELNNLIRANAAGSTLQGGGGRDILVAGRGADQLTGGPGGPGGDIFRFEQTGRSGDRITDFMPGEDVIDLRALFGLYKGSDPVADGWLRLQAANGGTLISFDPDGSTGPSAALQVVTLTGIAPNQLVMQGDWVFL